MKIQSDRSLLAVVAASAIDEPRAEGLARKLDLQLMPTASNPMAYTAPLALLIVEEGALRLQQTGRGAPGPVAVDFGGAAMRHRRRSGHNELLGRAVGVGKKLPLAVLDATAGLGRDSFVLADLGCQVMLCEREPLLVAMLQSALTAAAAGDDPWLAEVAGRMVLCPGDAREFAPSLIAGQDVIYLDPMFPERNKRAAVKKEMALLQKLLQGHHPEGEDDALLTWALDQPVARVVVKRPPRAASLGGGGRRPSHQLASKAVRFDVYTLGAWR